jgi:AcrR family transcriptional regulator
MELFSRRAYEEISVDEIADRAGISRGLLYHYFPTKRDFYAAVTRAAAEEVEILTAPVPSMPVGQQLRAGIEAFLAYAESHPHGFLSAYRGGIAGDRKVRAMVERGRRRQTRRILQALGAKGEHPPAVRLAVYGWTAMVQAVTAEWLERPEIDRAQLADMLTDALASLVSSGEGAFVGQSGRPPSRGTA